MKNLFNTRPESGSFDTALLIARVGISLLMLSHGLPKLGMLLSGESVQFVSFAGLNPVASLALAVFAEVICSVLLLIGFASRLAVIPLIITMIVALSYVHAADPLAKQEPALHYLLVYFVLLLTGSGKYSVDHFLKGKRAKAIVARDRKASSPTAMA